MPKTDYTKLDPRDPARRAAKSQHFRDRLSAARKDEIKNPAPGMTQGGSMYKPRKPA